MAINILQKGGNRICHIPPTPKVVGFLWLDSVKNKKYYKKDLEKEDD